MVRQHPSSPRGPHTSPSASECIPADHALAGGPSYEPERERASPQTMHSLARALEQRQRVHPRRPCTRWRFGLGGKSRRARCPTGRLANRPFDLIQRRLGRANLFVRLGQAKPYARWSRAPAGTGRARISPAGRSRPRNSGRRTSRLSSSVRTRRGSGSLAEGERVRGRENASDPSGPPGQPVRAPPHRSPRRESHWIASACVRKAPASSGNIRIMWALTQRTFRTISPARSKVSQLPRSGRGTSASDLPP